MTVDVKVTRDYDSANGASMMKDPMLMVGRAPDAPNTILVMVDVAAFEDPRAWGHVLADIVENVADAYGKAHDINVFEVRRRMLATFDAARANPERVIPVASGVSRTAAAAAIEALGIVASDDEDDELSEYQEQFVSDAVVSAVLDKLSAVGLISTRRVSDALRAELADAAKEAAAYAFAAIEDYDPAAGADV